MAYGGHKVALHARNLLPLGDGLRHIYCKEIAPRATPLSSINGPMEILSSIIVPSFFSP